MPWSPGDLFRTVTSLFLLSNSTSPTGMGEFDTHAVIGAGGPTGQETVKRLLQEEAGARVRAIVRSPDKHREALGSDPRLDLVAGDVTDAKSLATALSGSRDVVFAASGSSYWSAKGVDELGVKSVAEAAKAAGLRRVVLVSSALVTPKNRFSPIRALLNTIRWRLMDHKFAGENWLRSSGVPYTVIRPGHLTNGPGGQAQLSLVQGDSGKVGAPIPRADVAAVAVAALKAPKAENRTFELFTVKGSGAPAAGHLATLFDGLQPGHDS